MVRQSVAAIGLATVAIVTTGLAWREDVPDLTATDAVDAMEEALQDIGLEATVEADPVSTTYFSGTREPVDVWAVQATVRSEPIEMQLARSGAQPVAIDDRSRDGSSYVLSEREYDALATSIDDPGQARTIRRNIAFTVAAVLVIALSLVHAAATRRKEQP